MYSTFIQEVMVPDFHYGDIASSCIYGSYMYSRQSSGRKVTVIVTSFPPPFL